MERVHVSVRSEELAPEVCAGMGRASDTLDMEPFAKDWRKIPPWGRKVEPAFSRPTDFRSGVGSVEPRAGNPSAFEFPEFDGMARSLVGAVRRKGKGGHKMGPEIQGGLENVRNEVRRQRQRGA